MKTLISATVLALVSSSAIAAESWWGGFGNNPEVDPYYQVGKPATGIQHGDYDFTTSLDHLAKGNPDLYAGFGVYDDIDVQMDSASFVTSLEKLTIGNPDIDTGPGWTRDADRFGSLAAR
jgi:hypothetical protein